MISTVIKKNQGSVLEPEKKTILIVGDVMIDRTWLIRSSSIQSTSQAHAGIKPEKLIDPSKKNTDMLAGAGTPTRRLLASSKEKDIKVHVIGGWSDELDITLFKKPNTLIPEIKDENRDRIKFERFVSTKFDTLKWRIYSSESGKTSLIKRYDRDLRYDQDPKKSDYIKEFNFEWPPSDSISAVIVADFAKGLLNLPHIREKLKEYNKCPFLLRTKQKPENVKEILTDLPWTVLLPNREDLARILESRDIRPRALKLLQDKHVTHVAINPHILEIFDDLLIKLKKWKVYNHHENSRDIFLKLDHEGGILLTGDLFTGDGTICPIALKPEDSSKDLAGIGSGDVLMAELAIELVKNPKVTMSDKYRIYGNAVKQASIYTFNAKDINRKDRDWYGRILEKSDHEIKQDIEPFIENEPKTFFTVKNNWYNASHLNIEKDSEIELFHADWYLENYITTEHEFGLNLEDLRERLANYVKNPGQRPFVVAICGKPGVGKSFLAKTLAKIIDCDYIEGNAAQWTSFDDFFMICEKIRSSQIKPENNEKPPVVFLDEIDSTIGMEHIYGKLLAPLWDRKYTKNGEEREIGPVIFLLAGSDPDWENEEELLQKHTKKGTEKLNDLVSRLSFQPVTIKDIKERKNDTIYLVVNLIKERFPKATKIERKTLYLLCESPPKHGVRSLRQALEKLQMVEEDGKVYLVENNRENESILYMHFKNIKRLNKSNKDDPIEIKTEPKKIKITVLEDLN
jgi:DNA polymerase III delta prime subunit